MNNLFEPNNEEQGFMEENKEENNFSNQPMCVEPQIIEDKPISD